MSDDNLKDFSNRDDKLDRIIEMLRLQSLRIEALEEKVDERLKDTRPLWEGVQNRLDQLEKKVDHLEKKVDQGFEAVQSQLLILIKKMEIMTQDIMQVRAEHRLLDERVDKLERKPS